MKEVTYVASPLAITLVILTWHERSKHPAKKHMLTPSMNLRHIASSFASINRRLCYDKDFNFTVCI